MTSRTAPTTHPSSTDRSAFRSVLCGVDGSPSALEAVRQAAWLAAPDGHLDLVCVREARGFGPNAQATISAWRAQESLEDASFSASELGVSSSLAVVESSERAGSLIERAAAHDLIAVGAHVRSRIGGIMLGSTASTLLHASPRPVLVARPARDGELWMPNRILVASDGSPHSALAAELAARVAAQHGSQVLLVSVRPAKSGSALRQSLAEHAATLGEASGAEVVVLRPGGDPAEQILSAAAEWGTPLIVLGSRGTTGLRSLGSVSERVAHRARCSVLVARTDRGAGDTV
jgi:nucleotide-binding universal stress UspA family protein